MSFSIIDSHMHMGCANGSYVGWDLSLKTLLERMDRLDIGYAVSAHQFGLDGQFDREIPADHEIFRASGGRIYSYLCYSPLDIEGSLKAIRANHADPIFRGIKIHPSGCSVDADDERYRPVWDAAREFGLPIISHTWNISYYHPSQKSAFTGKFEKYVSEYPDVSFTFAHSGGRYDGIVEAMRIGRTYRNTYFDIAGDILGSGVLEYIVDNVGADRLMYGSDTYMIEHRPMLGVIYGSALPEADKEKILRYNAEKVYFSDISLR